MIWELNGIYTLETNLFGVKSDSVIRKQVGKGFAYEDQCNEGMLWRYRRLQLLFGRKNWKQKSRIQNWDSYLMIVQKIPLILKMKNLKQHAILLTIVRKVTTMNVQALPQQLYQLWNQK